MKIWNPATDTYNDFTFSTDEEAYWHVKTAMLDPAALVHQTYYGTFDVNTVTNPLYVINAWNCQIDARSNSRYDVRVPPFLDAFPTILPVGTRITGLGTGSSLHAIDPTLVSYADPRAKYFERMARLGTLEQRAANQNGTSAATAWIDDSRAVFTTPPPRSNTSLYMTVGGGSFGCAQRVYLPFQVNTSSTIDVSMYLQRVTGNSGDLRVDIRTDSGGSPSGSNIGTVTITAANLPALDAGAAWVTATITLTGNFSANTIYHLQLLNASGSTSVCQWRGAEGSDTTYSQGKYHDTGSGNWVAPTGFSHFACALNQDDIIDYLVVHAAGFDTPWVVILGEFTGANVNLWTEINDTTPTQRSGGGIAVPWDIRYGQKYRMNGGGSANTRASWLALELPSDW